MACNIVGQVVIPDGSSAANRQITLRKEDFTISAQGSLSILPEEIVVYTDASGNVDFDLVAGTYSGYYVSSPDGRAPFRLRVPEDTVTANFADLIVVTSVTYDPALTKLVLDAKDAIENGGSGGGGTNAVWGSITGTLSNQTDLNTALAGKASTTALNLKANITDVTAGLAAKADTTAVDSALALKADTSAVNTALALKANVSDVLTGLAGKSDIGHTHTFDSLTSKPTDVAGYGITDAVTLHSTQTISGKKHFSEPVVHLGSANDPGSVEDGGVWYNETDKHLKARLNGSVVCIDGQATSFLLPPSGEYVITSMGSGTGGGTLQGSAGRLDMYLWTARATFVVTGVSINCTTAVASSGVKVVVYECDSNGRPDKLIYTSAEMDCSTTGMKTASANFEVVQGKKYSIGLWHSSTATVSTWGQNAVPDINGGTSITSLSRKVFRRSVSFASSAPDPWGYSGSEIFSGTAPSAVWFKV